MKIKPDFRRVAWRNLHRGCKHRPQSRVLRDHRKALGVVARELVAMGHQAPNWRYWYGQSTCYCDRCGKFYRLSLGAKTLVVARCEPKIKQEAENNETTISA
jgi:hypothetical protein